MLPDWPAPVERIEVCLGDEETRLPHARLRHLARSVFSDQARVAPCTDPHRLDVLLGDELVHVPATLRRGVEAMATELRRARRHGDALPSITFRLLAKGGLLVEELDA